MRFIAHRVFKDGETFDGFDAGRLDGYHGVELDIREDGRGDVCIDHAPLFLRRRGARGPSGRSISDAVELFAESIATLEVLFLDVKSRAAAEILAKKVARSEIPFETVFTCWYRDDVQAIRDVLPTAKIFFCVAPIFTGRQSVGRLSDLYISNSFPFVSRSSRFQPNDGKANRHNINLKLISRRTLEADLPEAIDGVCVHRIFRSASLMTFIQQRSLKAAFYGLPSRAHPLTQALAPYADFAIIRKESPIRSALLRASARHNHDKAA